MTTAAAQANPNIAFIKYWGICDETLNLPANSSLSMNLAGLETRTRVTFDRDLRSDTLSINSREAAPQALERASALLERVRRMAGINNFAAVESENNFPAGAGIASSASAFAALALAASAAAGLELDERSLSCLARTGSGSASRSIPAGFVEWQAGSDDTSSYAYSIASPDHWDLVDCIAIASEVHKPVGSTQGHQLAGTSPLQPARLEGAQRRLEQCRRSILERDFDSLALVTELDSNLMHAVMLTSNPPLLYWQAATLAVMHAVVDMRDRGLPVCYTIDAGPNVHAVTTSAYASQVAEELEQVPGILQVLTAPPGGAARLLLE